MDAGSLQDTDGSVTLLLYAYDGSPASRGDGAADVSRHFGCSAFEAAVAGGHMLPQDSPVEELRQELLQQAWNIQGTPDPRHRFSSRRPGQGTARREWWVCPASSCLGYQPRPSWPVPDTSHWRSIRWRVRHSGTRLKAHLPTDEYQSFLCVVPASARRPV